MSASAVTNGSMSNNGHSHVNLHNNHMTSTTTNGHGAVNGHSMNGHHSSHSSTTTKTGATKAPAITTKTGTTKEPATIKTGTTKAPVSPRTPIHSRNNNGSMFTDMLDFGGDLPDDAVADSDNAVSLDFSQDDHRGGVLSSINSLRKQGQFCDIKLVVGDREVAAHRAVLAASSPYLFDFLSCLEESAETQPIYKLKDVSMTGFQYLLDYMYSGRLSVPLNDVPVVYGTALALKMESATRACADFLSSHLTASNCLGIRRFSRDNNFRSSVDDYIRTHMEAIMNSKSFFGLKDLQVEVVGLDESISDEMMERRLFCLVLDWAKNNLNDLKPKMERLTEQVNLLYLNPDNTLMDCADLEDALLSSDDDMVIDYKKLARRRSKTKVANGRGVPTGEGVQPFHKFSLNPEEALSVAEREWSIIATRKTSDNAYLAIAVLDGQLMAISVHVRPPVPGDANGTGSGPDSPPANGIGSAAANDSGAIQRKAFIAPLEWMSKPRCAMGAVALNGQLLVCGGYDRGECLKSVETFNIKENVWQELLPMNAPRGRFGASVVGGCLYTCGGSDGSKELSCTERFDPSTRKWKYVASMLKERSSHGVATLNGKLYCIGGCEGQRSIASCEVYDPAINKWSSIASLNVARSQTCVCAVNGQLFAIGGTDLWNTLNSVEVYTPEQDSWTLCSTLNIARRGAGVDIVNGMMVVVGGSDGTQSLASSELYDFEANLWTVGPSMTIARANLSAVTIGARLYAVGGFSGKKFLSSAEWLDIEGGEWLGHVPRLMVEVTSDGMQEEENTEREA